MQDHFWYRPGDKPAKGKDTRPGFKIRMASLLERSEFEAELDGRYQAASVPDFIMLNTAIEGIHALLEGDEAAQLEELLRSFHGDALDERGEISKEERAQISEIEAVLGKNWPPYRQLVEQNARYRNMMPLLAFQRFIDGWENVQDKDGAPVEYERDKAGNIPESLLRRLYPALIFAVGMRAYNFQYAGGEEKN